jgi:hypothetical protein
MLEDCKYFQIKKAIVYMYGEENTAKKTQEFALCNKALEFSGVSDPCPLYMTDMDPEKECPFYMKKPEKI